jgi:predicted PurR-regulated permease PerM
MNAIKGIAENLTPQSFMDAMIRLGLIAFLAFACFLVFSPFLVLMVWALMLAIMLFPLHQKFARKIGGKQGLASTLMVLVVLLVIVPPIVLISGSLVEELKDFQTTFESGDLAVAPPDPAVRDWPVIGERLYENWSQAAKDLPGFLESHATQVKNVGVFLFEAAGNTLGTTALFLVAFAIAGVMMAFGRQGAGAMERIFGRIAGTQAGPNILTLVVATVRSVATGVLGVAFIQALLFGIGFVLAGVPAGGLLALLVLFLGIIQLPATLVAIPVIIFMWSGDSSTVLNVIFTVYFLVAGLADNVLKPMLLGRGVAAPMPVILIGAIGGMAMGGIIGLFLGAAILAVGYQLFMKWSYGTDDGSSPSTAQPEPEQ